MKANKSVESDTSITSKQYQTYLPYVSTFNYQDEIRIVINSQNSLVLPSESYIYIEGTFFRAANAVDGQANPAVVCNFASFMFDNMRYELNSTEIDKCKNVGITSTLKILSTMPNSEYRCAESSGLVSANQEAQAPGTFAVVLPLKHYFGFCEDYRSILMNSKHELILTRSRNDVNSFHGANNNMGITINQIQWRMPHIRVDDYMQLRMLKQIESNEAIPLSYRSWDLYENPGLPQTTRHCWSIKSTSHLTRPRYVFLAFQTNRENVITRTKSQFDPIALTDARLYLNSDIYPQESMNLNFAGNRAAIAYDMYKKFRSSFYHDGSGSIGDWMYTLNDFLTSPFIVFDCSRQNESLKTSAVDVRIEFQTSVNMPAQTTAYALIIHDNITHYNPLTNIVVRSL